MTKVFFRKEINGEILAVFPESWKTNYWGCYAHIGQHSDCMPEYVRECTKPAKPQEYADLLAELRRIGYDNLQILKRMPKRK